MNQNNGNLTKEVKDAVSIYLYKNRDRIRFVFHIFIFNIQIIESIVKEGDGISSASEEEEKELTKSSPKVQKFSSPKTPSFQKKTVSVVKKMKELGPELLEITFFCHAMSCSCSL
jgi:hypothetical protein